MNVGLWAGGKASLRIKPFALLIIREPQFAEPTFPEFVSVAQGIQWFRRLCRLI
ncbi:MAG: hypothetical protein R3C20_11865 [Planctomycetaceae bacterium]